RETHLELRRFEVVAQRRLLALRGGEEQVCARPEDEGGERPDEEPAPGQAPPRGAGSDGRSHDAFLSSRGEDGEEPHPGTEREHEPAEAVRREGAGPDLGEEAVPAQEEPEHSPGGRDEDPRPEYLCAVAACGAPGPRNDVEDPDPDDDRQPGEDRDETAHPHGADGRVALLGPGRWGGGSHGMSIRRGRPSHVIGSMIMFVIRAVHRRSPPSPVMMTSWEAARRPSRIAVATPVT